jgi:hypothetical protein
MNTVDPKVYISHCKNLSQNNFFSDDEVLLLELVYSSLNTEIHPASVLSTEALDTLKNLTKLDITRIHFSGIAPYDPSLKPQNTLDTSQDNEGKKIPVSSCVYFSLSHNLSPHYKYANIVDTPTCSHPDSPFGVSCKATIMHTLCPYYSADKEELQYTFEDASYDVLIHRNKNGFIEMFISDSSNNNIVSELSYPSNEFSQFTQQQVNAEISSIISEFHSHRTTNPSSFYVMKSIQENEDKPSSQSYISTLVG